MKQEDFQRVAIVVRRNQQDYEREHPKPYTSSSSSSSPKTIYHTQEEWDEIGTWKGLKYTLLYGDNNYGRVEIDKLDSDPFNVVELGGDNCVIF